MNTRRLAPQGADLDNGSQDGLEAVQAPQLPDLSADLGQAIPMILKNQQKRRIQRKSGIPDGVP